jgi:hypothetical protein
LEEGLWPGRSFAWVNIGPLSPAIVRKVTEDLLMLVNSMIEIACARSTRRVKGRKGGSTCKNNVTAAALIMSSFL